MDRILIIDDEKLIRLSLQQNFIADGYQVLTTETGEDGIEVFNRELPDAVLLDLRLPDINGIEVLKRIKSIDEDALVVMITGHGMVKTAVEAMKLGAYDFIEKPFEVDKVKFLLKKALEANKLKREVKDLKREQKERYGFDNIVGTSKAMQEVFKMMEKLSKTDTTLVLLQGESGTGKDIIAKAIHYQSLRGDKPFVEINCTSIPETLIESELFGHEKSAFTDAKAMKKGLFELADTGTIFLDEIGDMALSTQAKLLKVIESKTFKRVGGTKDISVDVRIIAATNKDLAAMVREGKFREDLYYRLMVIPIYLPPLRERRDDIIPLVKYYIDEFNKDIRGRIKYISPEAEELLIRYPWPGNVRELKNVVERISILESGDTLLPEHLPPDIRGEAVSFGVKAGEFRIPFPEDGISLEKVEEDLIREALSIAKGNQTRAASLLSISRDTLRYRMKKFGIED